MEGVENMNEIESYVVLLGFILCWYLGYITGKNMSKNKMKAQKLILKEFRKIQQVMRDKI